MKDWITFEVFEPKDNKSVAERRLGIVRVSNDIMESLFKEVEPKNLFWRVTKGVPGDAELLRIGYGSIFGELFLVYSHPSFPPVDPSCLPPYLDVLVSSHFCDQMSPSGFVEDK